MTLVARLAAVTALVLIAAAATQCGGDDSGGGLHIDRLEYESLVFINGDRLPLTIHWQGDAEFPVTVSLVVPEGECPSDVSCHDEDHVIAESANPIVVPEALWCTGYGPAWSAPFDVTIEDASGTRSDSARMEYTCRE